MLARGEQVWVYVDARLCAGRLRDLYAQLKQTVSEIRL